MTRLAEKAGTAGNHSTSQKKLGLLASFVAAACMTLSSACAWAAPETKNGEEPAAPTQETLTKAANNNPKSGSPTDDEIWTIRLSGEVNQSMAEKINDHLRMLNKLDPNREIKIIINSGGGSVTAGMSIYDTMQSVSNDIRTVCEGSAMSMAAVLLAAGTPGKRESYQSCEIMIHEVSSNLGGRLSSLKTWGEDVHRANEKLVEVLHQRTGLSKDNLRDMMIEDIVFISAQEAKDMGLIDSVIPPKEVAPAAPRKIPDEFCKLPERQRLRVCP